MSAETGAIIRTRAFCTDMFASVVNDINGRSEVEVRDMVLQKMSDDPDVFPSGWYDPPVGGVSMLFGDPPFERLRYDTLRKAAFWPSDEYKFGPETVGMLYASPLDRATYMLGDTGFTVYGGTDQRVRDHVRISHEVIRDVAEYAKVGMKFSELYAFGTDEFRRHNLEVTPWMTAYNDPSKVGLGHTVPGSYGEPLAARDFESAKEAITVGRKYISALEPFVIPETVAFTVEARLVDRERQDLPSFFHFIVLFDVGKKMILGDFNAIFERMNMDYMMV